MLSNELSLEELKMYLKKSLHIFGECVLEIKDDTDGKEITVIDSDVYSSYINAKGEVVDEDVDMSSVALVLYTNKKDEVSYISHNYTGFTKANKQSILLVLDLLGKTINYRG